MMYISHDVYDQSSCKIAKMANCHVTDAPMLPFPEIIYLKQKYSSCTWTENLTAVPPRSLGSLRDYFCKTVKIPVKRPVYAWGRRTRPTTLDSLHAHDGTQNQQIQQLHVAYCKTLLSQMMLLCPFSLLLYKDEFGFITILFVASKCYSKSLEWLSNNAKQ